MELAALRVVVLRKLRSLGRLVKFCPMTKLSDSEADFCLRVGKFLMEFSQLEASIRTELAHAIHLQSGYTDIVVSDLGFEKLLSVAQAVLGDQHPESKDQIIRFVADCRNLNDARVSVAQGLPENPSASSSDYSSRNAELFKLIEEAQTLAMRVSLLARP
jgi:hypothetical protein